MGREAMAARDRWLLVEDNGELWLLKRQGHELHGRTVSRDGRRREFPRLYTALVASTNRDAPFVVVEG
jgi:hypothetical protein